jgi:hypothetical protein
VAAAETAIALSSPPSPDECPHPSPVRGVLAHEFGHYQGAHGPEGLRRTVTYYGPVIGGLPIDAWHCEVCGLLRLNHPDGRTEERRLFPGPQPGLLAEISVASPGRIRRGRQPNVSGLSVPETEYERMFVDEVPAADISVRIQLPQVELPRLGFLGWANVLGLTAILLGLLIAGLVAVLPESLQPEEAPLVLTLGLIFAVLVVMNAASPLWRRVFPMPALLPSVAVTARGRPSIDTSTAWAVGLMVASLVGLFASAVLAVYWYNTAGATLPVFVLSVALGLCAALVEIAGAAARALRR